MIGIYKITNKLNNKSYIGQSIDIQARWSSHKWDIQFSDKSWYSKAREESNSIDDFEFTVLKECLKEELDKYEYYYIEQYHSYYNGYNKTYNGRCNPSHSEPFIYFDIQALKKIDDFTIFKDKMSENAFNFLEYLYKRTRYKTFPYQPQIAANQLKVPIENIFDAIKKLETIGIIQDEGCCMLINIDKYIENNKGN